MIFFFYGFTKYCKTHNQLTEMSNHITLSLQDLPEPKDLLIADYQKHIRDLFDAYHRLETESDYKRMAMVDYYTLWVHQIKTPISALYLIIESDPNERNLTIKSELFKIEQYVEMVLHYLRLESESSDLQIENLSLEKLVKSSLRKYRTLFIEKGIKLNLAPIEYSLLTDEKWFCFAFEQILSNALKYTHAGEINISLLQSPARLVIKDTGIGIQAEDLPRIFDKGFTGFNGRMDKKSTGIGLYLCKSALKKLSHQIEVTSEIGVGTTVSIHIERDPIVIE
ncbi:sensor histidine kinase [Fusibacter bizertensis]|uniref:histidine kinase n=1 Tax=Fusibacter bizertensis TaxID=1488331 RepID=A0ABT6NAB7_9FIRM|nr:sensor histidine kinase [Fusibacter bizertensis]MDH8677349.1 sensor histidine kinase [Fusibacter bizertensis]